VRWPHGPQQPCSVQCLPQRWLWLCVQQRPQGLAWPRWQRLWCVWTLILTPNSSPNPNLSYDANSIVHATGVSIEDSFSLFFSLEFFQVYYNLAWLFCIECFWSFLHFSCFISFMWFILQALNPSIHYSNCPKTYQNAPYLLYCLFVFVFVYSRVVIIFSGSFYLAVVAPSIGYENGHIILTVGADLDISFTQVRCPDTSLS
jgi:hypothetical protein